MDQGWLVVTPLIPLFLLVHRVPRNYFYVKLPVCQNSLKSQSVWVKTLKWKGKKLQQVHCIEIVMSWLYGVS